MDSQFNEWQQAFKKATPKIDVDALIAQVNQSRRAEKLKAWADLVIGFAVSCLCLFMLLTHASEIGEKILFALLTPIPLSVGVWAFMLRKKQWRTSTLDVESLLAYKHLALQVQMRYWWVNLLGVTALFTAVLGILLTRLALGMSWHLWLAQLGVFAAILGVVIIKYTHIKRNFPRRLEEIERLRTDE